MTLNELDKFNIKLETLNPEKLNIHPLLKQRASRASFSSKELDRTLIIQLLQAARCAPSFHNSQPWYFIVVSNRTGREEINQSLQEGGADWAVNAPVLLAVVVNLTEDKEMHGIDYRLFDAGLAVQNVLLQAVSLGLSVHPVNYYRSEIARAALRLPESHELLLMIAAGHPGGEPSQTYASRLRKPLPAIAAWDRWDGSPVVG